MSKILVYETPCFLYDITFLLTDLESNYITWRISAEFQPRGKIVTRHGGKHLRGRFYSVRSNRAENSGPGGARIQSGLKRL